MKTKLMTTIMITLFLASITVIAVPVKANGTTKHYGDVTLSGGFQSGNFPEEWDLTVCGLVINFTVDLTGMVDDFGGGAHAWSELGVRDTTTTSNFNPGAWITGGKGVWLATDYDWTANTFNPDPPGFPTLDIDDKLILQRGGGADERYYDLPSAPLDPWTNYGIWFDRDDVDPWQATYWGCIDGGTYNTGGTYEVVITLQATSATSGTAYMTVNGVDQGFWVTGWKNAQPEMYPAGMTFTGDMAHMQVFYGLYGYGATHTVVFEDITVSGCLYTYEVDIDIKPGSCPNSINLKSKGVLPVAVLTTADFDASDVNPSSVFFAGASPLRWTMEDVDEDGDMDLLFHFKTQDLNLESTSTEATLTGYTTWDNPITGTDSVKIVPK
jgi:hypothetical protein